MGCKNRDKLVKHQIKDILSWNSSTWCKKEKAVSQGFRIWSRTKESVFLLPTGCFLLLLALDYSLQIFNEHSMCTQDYIRIFNSYRRKMINHHYSQGTYSPTKPYQWKKTVFAPNTIAQNATLVGINQKKEISELE